ncbi:MAG TPA: hypothetical protein VEX64_04400 [Pyrinomonadaceae bacterium]|nr:hypothetical protein [Pyrinomonadaceae bacterium]
MRNLFLLFLLTVFVSFQAFAQEKPLTQAEFVRELYALQKNPAKREVLVEQIRKRGIAFELTSGLRGLIQSKSGDELLRRTLEEAARRRENPIVAALPSEKEANEVLAKAREATLAALEDMPDFVVKQQISRSNSYAKTNNFQSADKLTVAVSYRASGGEEYRVLAINGMPQPEEKEKPSYLQVGGTTSAGEFVTVLASIFKPESKAQFAAIDTDTLRGRRSIVYSFVVRRENSKQRLTSFETIAQSTISGYEGRIWVDRENFRVLRVESIATEIPEDFPIRAAIRTVDYDWVTIGDAKYLLPLSSDVRLTSRYRSELFESRNEIRFRNYQKFGTEIRILDDEETVEETPEPAKKP